MKRNINTAHLTKSYIESKVSQELIVSKYLNIPMDVIKDCIDHNHLIESVFRDNDINKSMGIQYNNKGRLKVRDFGGFGFFDDVYGVVAYVLGIIYNRTINTNNKQDFYFVLKHIVMTFSDIFDGVDSDPNIEINLKYAQDKIKNNRAKIDIAFREWNKEDSAIWRNWGISLNYLNTHFVYAVNQYYINKDFVASVPDYYYSSKDPCYAYFIGRNDVKGEVYWKLYFPLRDRKKNLKFITNCNAIEGWYNFEPIIYDYIIITKSTKDRLSIGNHLLRHSLYGGCNNKLNIAIVNLPSESYKLHKEEYEMLLKRVKDYRNIYSLLDFDTTGREGARYLKDTYNINYLFITRGEFGLPNYGCKDFSELYEHYDENKIDSYVKETLKYIQIKYERNFDENNIPY